MTLDDLAAHAQNDSLDPRFLGLLGDRLQRFLQRQSGTQQGGQLARQQGQIERREPAAHESAGPALLELALSRLLDVHGQEVLLAQQLAHMLGGVALDESFALLALRIESRVFERAHQSSRVTRRTSSSVVSPNITFLRPSSRMPGLDWRA